MIFWRGNAPALIETPLQGASLSHDSFFSRPPARRAAALSYSKVGMSGPWRPKLQLRFRLVAHRAERSSVPAGDAMAALPRKWVSGGLRLVADASESAPTLPFGARAQGVGSLID
jgi:hypothetical protein